MGWGLPGILRLLPSPTLVPRDHLSATLATIPRNAVIIDVGAGGRRVTDYVITVDAVATQGVDVVGDIHHLPFSDDYADCVLCTGTLEHVSDPFRAVAELYRILKPGEVVHIDVPFIQGYHADPCDYWRFTLDGLRLMCKAFDHTASGVQIGPTCGVIWVVREWTDSLSPNKWLSNLMLAIVALGTAPLRYLDYLVVNNKRSHRVASAVYFRGIKPFCADSSG